MVLAGDQVLRPLPQERQPVSKIKKKALPVERLKLSGLVLLGFVLGLTVILCQARAAYVGYRLTELQTEMARVRAENQAIEGALQRLVAPDKIEAVAVQRLGMVKPAAGAELRVPAPMLAARPENTAEAESESVTQREEVSWLKAFLDILSFKHSDPANGSWS